jgi:hypothetical protein
MLLSKCVLISGHSYLIMVSLETIRMGIFMFHARMSSSLLLCMMLIYSLHKRNYRFDNGECTNDPEMRILAFDVKEQNGALLVKLPPADELDEMIGSSKCE